MTGARRLAGWSALTLVAVSAGAGAGAATAQGPDLYDPAVVRHRLFSADDPDWESLQRAAGVAGNARADLEVDAESLPTSARATRASARCWP